MQHPRAAWRLPGVDPIMVGMREVTVDRSVWRRPAVRLICAIGVVWGPVVAVEFFRFRVAMLWIFALVVYAGVYLLAAVLTIAFTIGAWRKHGPAWSAATLATSAAAAAVILAVDWTWTSVHGTFLLNRPHFAAVAALSEAGALESDEYYGARLPLGLGHLSVHGTAARIDAAAPDTSVLFLPAWLGIPDGGVGYAYLGDRAPEPRYDCFGDWCEPRWSLGGGWYWLE